MDQRRAWAWATALWCLMRIGISEGPRVALLYGSGDEKHSQALEQARQREIDVICLHFDERFEDGPSNIVVVAHGKGGITLSEHCQVWAFRTWSKIEILSETRRFSLGGGSTSLVSKQNNLIETRARGAAAAHQRWRKMAMEIAEEEAMAKPSDADTPPASAEPEPKSAADETLPKT